MTNQSVRIDFVITKASYYPISSLLSVSGRLGEVKNKRKFQTFSSKSGCGRLREEVAYKRFWYLVGKLVAEDRRGGRLREVVGTGGTTVSGKRFFQLFMTKRESIEFKGMLGNKIFQDTRPRKLREDVSS